MTIIDRNYPYVPNLGYYQDAVAEGYTGTIQDWARQAFSVNATQLVEIDSDDIASLDTEPFADGARVSTLDNKYFQYVASTDSWVETARDEISDAIEGLYELSGYSGSLSQWLAEGLNTDVVTTDTAQTIDGIKSHTDDIRVLHNPTDPDALLPVRMLDERFERRRLYKRSLASTQIHIDIPLDSFATTNRLGLEVSTAFFDGSGQTRFTIATHLVYTRTDIVTFLETSLISTSATQGDSNNGVAWTFSRFGLQHLRVTATPINQASGWVQVTVRVLASN